MSRRPAGPHHADDAQRRARGRDDGGGRDPAVDGLRDDRRAAGAGRPLHGARAAAGLRAGRHLAGAVGDDHVDDRGAHRRRGRDRRRGEQAMAAATTLAMLTGVLLLAAGALKLGFLADFISHPVLAGFKAGTGLLIAVGQLGKVLGIEQTGDSFFEKVRSALGAPRRDQLADRRRWPPPPSPRLLALKRTQRSRARWSRSARGSRSAPPGCSTSRSPAPCRPGLPAPIAPDLDLIGPLLPAAAGIALMSFVESIAAGRAIAHRASPSPTPTASCSRSARRTSRGGVFRSLPAGGGLSQTAVNDAAETKRAGRVTAAVTAAHAAVPHRPVRRPPAGHARRARAGVRDRPGRGRAAARRSAGSTAAASCSASSRSSPCSRSACSTACSSACWRRCSRSSTRLNHPRIERLRRTGRDQGHRPAVLRQRPARPAPACSSSTPGDELVLDMSAVARHRRHRGGDPRRLAARAARARRLAALRRAQRAAARAPPPVSRGPAPRRTPARRPGRRRRRR